MFMWHWRAYLMYTTGLVGRCSMWHWRAYLMYTHRLGGYMFMWHWRAYLMYTHSPGGYRRVGVPPGELSYWGMCTVLEGKMAYFSLPKGIQPHAYYVFIYL